ncbi:hypothetical protein [Polaromonas sp. UC242_47]|uniref:hypothetical protein n=1 Tax=Polaromonas sp. UC242_47 TaxID=3374626 RepID=UPI00379730C1
MQIDHIQTESASLAAFGIDAASLLVADNVYALVERFGYARALGRDCADAVRADLAATLAELGATAVVSADRQDPRVSYFKASDTGLFALVECFVPADNGKSVLLELVVTTDGMSTHITLEDLSSAV